MLVKNLSGYVTLTGIIPWVVFMLILSGGCVKKEVLNELLYRVVVSHGHENIDLTKGVSVELIDGISGLGTGKVANLYSAKREHDICIPSDSKDSYFLAAYKGGRIFNCLFEVIQVTNDRYRSVKNFIKENNIFLYTDDFGRGVIWIPAVCEYDIMECQKQINILRNLTE
jgi:hypothetical protein